MEFLNVGSKFRLLFILSALCCISVQGLPSIPLNVSVLLLWSTSSSSELLGDVPNDFVASSKRGARDSGFLGVPG